MQFSIYYSRKRVREVVANGQHREAIGGLWDEMGLLQMRWLTNVGMRPHHKLLDVGCGSLRLGVRAVDYLDAGNYFGTDLNDELLTAGYDAEIKAAGLAKKLPRENLVADGEFTFRSIPADVDFAIAQSVFTHLPLNHLRLCLGNLADHVAGPMTFLFTVFTVPNEGRIPVSADQKAGVVTHLHKDPYHCTISDIHQMNTGLPWEIDFIGEVGHPRGQKLVKATLK